MKKLRLISMSVIALALSNTVMALSPDELLSEYAKAARKADSNFKEFSAASGKEFFLSEHKNSKGEQVSCTSCHTKDPSKSGKTKAGKVIEPMAPSTNKERFSDRAKVEKWFKRNCKDVLERECTVLEKGNFVAFMKSL